MVSGAWPSWNSSAGLVGDSEALCLVVEVVAVLEVRHVGPRAEPDPLASLRIIRVDAEIVAGAIFYGADFVVSVEPTDFPVRRRRRVELDPLVAAIVVVLPHADVDLVARRVGKGWHLE